MISLGRRASIRKDYSDRGVRTTGFRSHPQIAVEHLEPRFLLSLTAVGRPSPDEVPTVADLRVVNIGPVDMNTELGATPEAGAPTTAASTASTGTLSVVPIPQARGFASFAVTKGLIASSVDSATYRIPGGATSFLVTLRVLSPQTQATWSLAVRVGDGREIDSVTVPRGQGGITVEILSPVGVEAGPITLIVAADPVQPGRPAGAYVLEVAAEGRVNVDPFAVATKDVQFIFIGVTPNGNELLAPDQPSRPPATPGPSGPSVGDVSVALPSDVIDPAYPKPIRGEGTRNTQPGGPSFGEQADTADSERSEQDGVVAQGDSPDPSDPASSARQLVDAPGGLPGTGANAEPREVLARRMAQEERLCHPGTPNGPVVVLTILAAGLIVPNVLLMGGPRFRPFRPERRLPLQSWPSD